MKTIYNINNIPYCKKNECKIDKGPDNITAVCGMEGDVCMHICIHNESLHMFSKDRCHDVLLKYEYLTVHVRTYLDLSLNKHMRLKLIVYVHEWIS